MAFVGGVDSVSTNYGHIQVELRSRLLDRIMHLRGLVKLTIESRFADAKKKGFTFVMDALQVESVGAYVRTQSQVRHQLETEGRLFRPELAGGNGDGSAIWREVKHKGLPLFPRHMLTPADRKALREHRPDVTNEQIDEDRINRT